MKRTRKRKLIFLVIIILIISSSAYLTIKYKNNPAPNQEIKQAIESISAAKKMEANKYAKKKLDAAENILKLAMKEWDTQNQKVIISRDYTQVRSLAIQASEVANQAGNEAFTERNSIKEKLDKQLHSIENQLDEFEKNYKNLPLVKHIFEKFSKAQMRFKEAQANYRNSDYKQAKTAANEAENLITPTLKTAQNILDGYFNDYPVWKKNANYARKLSAGGNIVILINKFESKCSVLKSGKTIAEYDAEFGSNWMSHKSVMGDNATPEGIYKITLKKNGSKTKYYKALLLNYPNAEDKKRFDVSKKNGAISKNSKIGDLIQIHGHGGKGVNWTEGCIALDNKDMDKLCAMVGENTPVIIIGTEKPINEYLK